MTEPEPIPDLQPEPEPDLDLSKIITPRTAATRDMSVMLGAVAAQRLQLEQLDAAGVDVRAQLTGLQLVETHLPSLVQYATQLEGIVAGLSVLKSPPDLGPHLDALSAALGQLAVAIGPQPVAESRRPSTPLM